MEISNLHIESLKGYEHNTRTHSEDQIQQIAGSISEFGFTNPILIDGDQRIIAGHGRLYAAKALGMDTVPCISLDHLSDVQVRALVIADNQIAMNAGWDEGLLATELDRLQTDGVDIDLLGFDVDTLEELLKPELIEIEGLTDEDAIPEVVESICQAGDIWVLGEHRLLCGDATRKADVEALMGGEKADMVFTDPPYNVDYEGYTEEKLTIKSDAMSEDEYIKFLSDTFGNYKNSVKRGGSLYVCHAFAWQMVTQQALKDHEIEVRNQIIWGKNTFAWGFGRYKFQHEPIFYCHIKGKSDNWYGDKSQSTLWLENKPAANRLHPTMKPVEIVLRATDNSSKDGDLIIDFFLGSGSTLIACEKTKRKCYGMEIDPHYCDVIVKRWQDYTGQQAIHAESEKPWQSV
jgi:DNA modification methylase